MAIFQPLSRPGARRRALSLIVLGVGLLAFFWPVHARAASGATWDLHSIRLANVHGATCPAHWQLGSLPSDGETAPPISAKTGAYLLSSYFTANCDAARYDRTSEVLLLVIAGGLLGFSGLRAEKRGTLTAAVTPAIA